MQRVLNSTSTWKLITIASMLTVIGVFGYVGWVERQVIVENVTGRKLNVDNSRAPNPSEATKNQFVKYANSKDYIMGVNIIKVDFRFNTRASTWRYYKNPEVESAWQEFLAQGKKAPLFGQNENQNQRLVNLINGQFSCIPTSETIAAQYIPTVTKYSYATCMSPIPPGYGDFIGFINIFLYRQPTGLEVSDIQKAADQLARDMYERDIVRSNKKIDLSTAK